MATAVTLPPDVGLELLAEGAANIVYRISLPSSYPGRATPPPSDLTFTHPTSNQDATTPPPTDIDLPPTETVDLQLQKKLLRLRKDLPWTSSNATLYHQIHSTIFPLLDPAYLVSHDLVALPTGLIESCNEQLRSAERSGIRPSKRCGVLLAADPFGLLVSDMTADESQGEVLLEVKPKWLAQSPSAPEGARRCRTCALREIRAAQGSLGEQRAEFCPLDLGSAEREGVGRAVSALLYRVSFNGKREGEALRERLVDFFLSTPILPLLRELQISLDPLGLLQMTAIDRSACVAMTLRDCTLFLKIPRTANGQIEAKLGDLDLKNAEAGKLEYWQTLEKGLIEGGWYGGKPSPRASVCRLAK